MIRGLDGALVATNGEPMAVANDYAARVGRYAYQTEDEAEGDFAGAEGDIRVLRFDQWDRAASIKERFGWGGVQRVKERIGIASDTTVRTYVYCAMLFPEELRVPDLASWVYYAALKVEREFGNGAGVGLVREVVEGGESEAAAWEALRNASHSTGPTANQRRAALLDRLEELATEAASNPDAGRVVAAEALRAFADYANHDAVKGVVSELVYYLGAP